MHKLQSRIASNRTRPIIHGSAAHGLSLARPSSTGPPRTASSLARPSSTGPPRMASNLARPIIHGVAAHNLRPHAAHRLQSPATCNLQLHAACLLRGRRVWPLNRQDLQGGWAVFCSPRGRRVWARWFSIGLAWNWPESGLRLPTLDRLRTAASTGHAALSKIVSNDTRLVIEDADMSLVLSHRTAWALHQTPLNPRDVRGSLPAEFQTLAPVPMSAC